MNQLTFNPMISGTERRVGQLFESEAPSVSTITADVTAGVLSSHSMN